MQDQQANLDFAYAAIGRVAEVAKRIIAQHYGKPPDKFVLRRVLHRRPRGDADDAALPAATSTASSPARPAMRTSFSGIGDRWVAATLNEIAPKNAQGQPVTRDALSESDKKTVIDGIVNACDAGDGVKDGLIFNINACRFDPKTLVCNGAKTDGCLSMAQAAALEKAFAGPKDSQGPPGVSRLPVRHRHRRHARASPGLLHGGQLVGGGGVRPSGWTSMPRSSRRWPIPPRA